MIRLPLLIAFVLCLVGCQRPSASRPTPVTAQRVVSLVPSLTELVFALGSGDRVVGVTLNDNFPEAVKSIEKVGDMTIDQEKVLALEPDLVLLDPELNRDQDRLAKLGLRVEALETGSLEKLSAAILRLGELLGRSQKAQELVQAIEQELDDIRLAWGDRPRPSVFVAIWSRPLMTAGRSTFVDEVIQVAGGQNCFSDLTGYPTVTHEALLRQDPDIIVLTSLPREQALRLPGWSQLRAVKEGRIYEVHSDPLVRPTTRVPEAARQLQQLFLEM